MDEMNRMYLEATIQQEVQMIRGLSSSAFIIMSKQGNGETEDSQATQLTTPRDDDMNDHGAMQHLRNLKNKQRQTGHILHNLLIFDISDMFNRLVRDQTDIASTLIENDVCMKDFVECCTQSLDVITTAYKKLTNKRKFQMIDPLE